MCTKYCVPTLQQDLPSTGREPTACIMAEWNESTWALIPVLWKTEWNTLQTLAPVKFYQAIQMVKEGIYKFSDSCLIPPIVIWLKYHHVKES